MTLKAKYLGLSIITAAVFLAAFSLFYVAKANPSFFIRFSTGSFATTTVAYQSAGAATTTLVMDMGVSGTQAADSAVLLQQFIGSSTASTQRTVIEYSQGGNGADCVNAPTTCNWYFGFATTTTALNMQPGGAQVSSAASSTELVSITVPTPTRYVRAVFSIPGGGLSGSIYAELAAKRQGN